MDYMCVEFEKINVALMQIYVHIFLKHWGVFKKWSLNKDVALYSNIL